MSWRFLIGKSWGKLRDAILRCGFPGIERYPVGRVCPFDVARLYRVRSLPPPSCLFDVGANVGDVSLYWRKWFPEARIHAFEPVASTHSVLARRVARFPQIEPHRLALAAAPGTMRIPLRQVSELNSLVEAELPHPTTGETEEIRIETFDAFCAARGIAKIDLLKVDVQGFEIAVLDGASGLLPNVRMLYLETGFHPEAPDLARFDVLFGYLSSKGFVFSGMYEPFRHGPAKMRTGFTNSLFLNAAFWRL